MSLVELDLGRLLDAKADSGMRAQGWNRTDPAGPMIGASMPNWKPISTAPKGPPSGLGHGLARGPQIQVRSRGNPETQAIWLHDLETFDVRQDRIVKIDGHWRRVRPEGRLQFVPEEWCEGPADPPDVKG